MGRLVIGCSDAEKFADSIVRREKGITCKMGSLETVGRNGNARKVRDWGVDKAGVRRTGVNHPDLRMGRAKPRHVAHR